MIAPGADEHFVCDWVASFRCSSPPLAYMPIGPFTLSSRRMALYTTPNVPSFTLPWEIEGALGGRRTAGKKRHRDGSAAAKQGGAHYRAMQRWPASRNPDLEVHKQPFTAMSHHPRRGKLSGHAAELFAPHLLNVGNPHQNLVQLVDALSSSPLLLPCIIVHHLFACSSAVPCFLRPSPLSPVFFDAFLRRDFDFQLCFQICACGKAKYQVMTLERQNWSKLKIRSFACQIAAVEGA